MRTVFCFRKFCSGEHRSNFQSFLLSQVCVVIQEVFPDGVVAKDGRLQPGDQLLEV